ncbi:LPS export ABC transporter periplasmic protein LptC [bacterium]|nr:LPS export ABC transporter periplasmic protein LptC [bacterium]
MFNNKFFKSKKNVVYVVALSIVILACLWAFISAGIITKTFKEKLIDNTYSNKEANIENLLVTETKNGEKLWELFAESGRYSESENYVILKDIIGNFYEDKKVKASVKADNGTYNTANKAIMLSDNVILVYEDGTYIKTDRIRFEGKDSDIVAEGNIRIEKPNEAVIMGSRAVLKGDFSDFHIQGRTQTQFYM